jgi:Na+/melibiose symporter-like transporter
MTASPIIDPTSRIASFTHASYIAASVLWFAFFAQWLTFEQTIIPDQVSVILGDQSSLKAGITGTIVAAGAFVALVVAPLAGALSDRLRSRLGRRRPFLIWGILGSCLALVLLLPFAPGTGSPSASGGSAAVYVYALAILNLQFWWNWAAGPYAGLVSDVVPEHQQDTASAWINVTSVLGTITGNVLILALYSPGRPLYIVLAFIGLNVACLLWTLLGVREPASSGTSAPFAVGTFVQSFWLSPSGHGDFYWVLWTRLFANLGIWSVFTFLLYYLREVIGLSQESSLQIMPILLLAGALLAIPSSFAGVKLAEHHGIVPVARWSNAVMAAMAVCYVLIAFRPNLYLVVPVVLIFSIGYGIYLATDWALALKVLPSRDAAGKDMGIWHVSMVFPQIAGPGVIGWFISAVTVVRSPAEAYAGAFAIGAFWLILAAALMGRIRKSY